MSRKIPQDAVLEQALRKAVTDARNSGSLESLSVNAARAAAEQQLGINADFFKSSGKWKARSKQIIGDAVVRLFNASSFADSSETCTKPFRRTMNQNILNWRVP